MNANRMRGFTLIELMVTVAIVGILAAIAVPNYSAYVVKGARSAAQTELLQLASLQEKIYLNSNKYTVNVATAYSGNSTGGLEKTGAVTSDGKYSLAINSDEQTYTLIATPVAGKGQVGNGCLTIQENGRRQWHENNDACNSAAPASW